MSLTTTDIASVCHAANRALCEANGDFSQVAWHDADSATQGSAIAGVAALQDDPTTTLAALHHAWCSFKEADGWVYGEVKDAERHTHPCLVYHDELTAAQRRKDHVFRAIVLALLDDE